MTERNLMKKGAMRAKGRENHEGKQAESHRTETKATSMDFNIPHRDANGCTPLAISSGLFLPDLDR